MMLGKTVGQSDGGAVGIVDLCLPYLALEILHCCHLRIGRLVVISLLTNPDEQLIPFLYERMGLHHRH